MADGIKLKSLRVLFGAVCSFVVCLMVYSVDSFARDTLITEGISIGDISIGGMTKDEAINKANEYVNTFTGQVITLGMDENNVDITAGELGYYWKNTDVIEEAASYCTKGNIIKRYEEAKDIENEPIQYDFELDVNDEVLVNAINSIGSTYNIPHKNAYLTRANGSFSVTPEVSGRAIDVEKSKSDLKSFLLEKWDGNKASQSLTVVEDKPISTAEDCNKVVDVIGTFSTTFSTSSFSRNKNLENGINKLNGITLAVGETMSVNSYLEPWTTSNGWYEGGTYVNGRVENTLGGGICQVSTTLYNAALNAEIEIAERANHSMTVGYVPIAMDAALAGTYKDLKLRNNTETPIYIEGIYEDGRITFNIYGVETRPANRSVVYKSERTSSYSGAYKSQLLKRVYIDGVLQSEEVVNTSTYTNGGGSPGTRTATRNQSEVLANSAEQQAAAQAAAEAEAAEAAAIAAAEAEAAAQAAAQAAAESLANAKNSAVSQINSSISGASDAVRGIGNNAINNINNAVSIEDVNGILNSAINDINNKKNKEAADKQAADAAAEAAKKLSSARSDAISKINAKITAESTEEVKAIANAAINKINSSSNENEISNIASQAISDINSKVIEQGNKVPVTD